MPKITGLGAGAAPANTDVLVLVSNTAGTANTQKVTVNTFFSDVSANAKFANLEATNITISTVTSVANVQSIALGHEYIFSNGALSTSIPLSILQGGTANAVVATLANSAIMGQIKVIVAYHVNQTTSVTMDQTLGSGVTYTFQTEGESLSLMWTGDHWAITSRGSNETGTNVQGTMDAS
jgi:sorbitol-specific phosphotransferase system component IIA